MCRMASETGTALWRVRERLRSGNWLTRERMRLVAVAVLIASVTGFAFLVVTAHGVIDRQGRPLGTDFSNVYAAGTYVGTNRAGGFMARAASDTRRGAGDADSAWRAGDARRIRGAVAARGTSSHSAGAFRKTFL
jgi:hypothetical protein